MKHCSIIVAFAVLASGVAFAAVLKFDPFKMSGHLQSDVQDIMNLVMKRHTLSRYIPSEVYEKMGLDPSTRLLSYSWDNCGNKTKENLLIHDLKFTPDPIVLPGTFSVSFNMAIKENVKSNLSATVRLSKKVASSWLEIPCIGNIGSCNYSDICTYLAEIGECPPEFQEAKVPCKCPFNQGTYVLPKASFEVDASFLPEGDYHIQANLTHGADDGGCYDIYASFG